MFRMFNMLSAQIRTAVDGLRPFRDRMDDTGSVGGDNMYNKYVNRPPSLLDSIAAGVGEDGKQQSAAAPPSAPPAPLSLVPQPSLGVSHSARVPGPKDVKVDNERLAPAIIHAARPYGSFVNFVKMVEWKHTRNQREAEHIAHSVDAYLFDKVSPLSDGMEMQLRRLAGIHLADEMEDWEVCERIQFIPTSKSLLPRAEVDRVVKSAVQRKRLMTAVGKPSAPSSGGRSGGNNNWKHRNRNPPAQSNPQPQSQSSAAPAAKSASAPPKNRNPAVPVS